MAVEKIFKVKDALEGEELEVILHSDGTLEKQTGTQFSWSNETQLWWRDGKAGSRLVVEFPVTEAGRYEVIANLTKAVDYAIVKVAVNDNTAQELDRFNDGVASDAISLGTFELPEGPNRLVVEIVGMNKSEKAVPRHMFGLDYLQLLPK